MKKKQRVESTIKVWLQLVDSTGSSYKKTTATKVSLSADADVIDFRDAVKAELSNKLASVDADELVVYRNSTSFEKTRDTQNKEESLWVSHLIRTDAILYLSPFMHLQSIMHRVSK
jgi:hypothetical protein